MPLSIALTTVFPESFIFWKTVVAIVLICVTLIVFTIYLIRTSNSASNVYSFLAFSLGTAVGLMLAAAVGVYVDLFVGWLVGVIAWAALAWIRQKTLGKDEIAT